MLAFMSITGIAGMTNIKGLKIALNPPEELHAGQPALCTLQLVNLKKRIPSFLLDLSCNGVTVLCPFLPRGASRDLPLPLQFEERGWAAVRQVQVRSAFPVNFFIRSWTLPLGCELLVFPRQSPCRALLPGGEGNRRDQGSLPRRGFEGEVERILEYTGREPLKQIHWKLSARGEEFKVKEYGEPAAEPLLIDPEKLPGGTEEQVACAAWLVRRWGMRRAVGLVLDGEVISPQEGPRQVRKLLARLALYRLPEPVTSVQGS